MQTDNPSILNDRKALITAVHKGEFLKPCPGTGRGYLCCGYQVLTPMTGCGMYCSYCILQAYFDHRCQVVYENFDDLEREVERKLSDFSGVIRIGTGEFGDSLYQEGNLGLCAKISKVLEPYSNVIVEFKTKSAPLKGLSKIINPHKTVIGFSMNTPAMIASHERNTAPLDQRLAMMTQCEKRDFYIGIHFDPMFCYADWENDYREVVRRIFSAINDPEKIAWWSLGGFRTNPALKKLLRREIKHPSLFAQEDLIFGLDGKYRYFRPIRAAFYRAVQEEIVRHAPETVLYLCMESEEVWKESGMAHRIPRGLPRYLDMRAQRMAKAAHGRGSLVPI